MLSIAQRITAAYLVATAIAVFVLFIITPLTHDGSPDYPIWKILNYFMAVAVVIMFVSACFRRCLLSRSGAQPGTLDHVGASIAFYGAIALAMLFFWSWFWTLNPDSETGEAVTSHIVYFPLMDALFTILGLATAKHMWTCAAGRAQ